MDRSAQSRGSTLSPRSGRPADVADSTQDPDGRRGGTSAAARRHHHGRQRPGRRARPAACAGAPRGRGGGAAHGRAALELKLPYLTVYSFSSENWSRPADEIDDLMGLMKRFIRRDLAELHQANVRIRVIGERAKVDPELVALVDERELTAGNTALTLAIAFNYGARAEIAKAARRLAEEAAATARARRHHGRAPRRQPRHRRAAGSRPAHPHRRRGAAVQFPSVAGGLY